MPSDQSGAAKLYHTNRPDTPWLVVFRDPTRCEKNKRAKRVQKWFTNESEAKSHRDKLNENLLAEGAAGVMFDATLRADAIAARRRLDAHGHQGVSLLQLAQSYCERVTDSAAADEPIGPAVEAFLDEKMTAEGRAAETRKNLSTRLWMWIDLAHIATVGDVNRASVEDLRKRQVAAQTKRNDLNAVSSFCTWLLEQGKIDHHPLKGLRRPKVFRARPVIFTPEECGRLLAAAKIYDGGEWLGTIAVMLFTGARPSELEDTRLFYGRHPLARLEGGKLRGRANRAVPLLPITVAWLREAGSPEQVRPLTRVARQKLCALAGIKWKHDICRHTFISHRLEMLKNDAATAREAGTSEDIIFRHYHRLPVAGALRRWLALRPGNVTVREPSPGTTAQGSGSKPARRQSTRGTDDADGAESVEAA